MTYTLKDLKHLEVMADLANATPVPPSEINIKTLLASDIVREIGIDEKILSLCSKLREEGFNKQAEGLESKFLTYKSAATHLYHVHNEEGEDLVNAAHPDGDNHLVDAADGLGDVETILSRHKKIIDVVNKEPKGKLATNKLLGYVKQCNAVLQKNAFVGLPFLIWVLNHSNDFNQGIATNTDKVISALVDIIKRKEITRSSKIVTGIHDTITKLTELKQFTATYQKIVADPSTKDMEFLKKYGQFIVLTIEPSVKKLYNMMIALRKEDESSLVSQVYRAAITSDFEDVQKSILGLWKALLEMTQSIKDAKTQYLAEQQLKKHKKEVADEGFLQNYSPDEGEEGSEEAPTGNEDSAPHADATAPNANERTFSFDRNERAPSFNRETQSPVTDAVTQLTGWLNAFPESQKAQHSAWINAQIKDIKDNANNPEKLQELLKENQEYKSLWKL